MYKAGAVLSAVMKVFTIPCHDSGHINIMLVLQSCTGSLRVLPRLSSGTVPSSSDGTGDIGNTKVEEDVDVLELCFIAINKEVDRGIKQEEIPEDITFRDIKAEPDEVSYVCICFILDTVYQALGVFFFFCINVFVHLKQLHCRK
jgi:hypothetical protein